MRKLRPEHGEPITRRALRFIIIRLGSRPESKVFQVDAIASRATLSAKQETWEEAVEQRVAGTAEIVYLDGRVNDEYMGIALAVRSDLGGKTDNDRWKQLFHGAPSDDVRPVGGSAQDISVTALVNTIVEHPEFDAYADRAANLKKANEAVKAAETARRALYVAEAMAQAERRIALDDAKRTYNLMYPRLQLVFPDDPALVESYFADLSPRGSDDGEQESTPTAPA